MEVVDVTAWVHKRAVVEKWDKGWLVVDGTHIPLAQKPGVLSQEHFCYKGFHSINAVLVILRHLLQIKPCLYLDKEEFILVDSGYGHSAITVGPFSHIAADKIEHVIAYLKNCFQCLTGYHGNIYHVKDRITAVETIQACIVTHTFASRYDCPADIADLLLPS
ncbi:uncharacterized protein UDID_17811 [Ustilago sp. UG-2017a]|nr:uncharacterized protein UDID_17811 [Ustilago sp. UG-2017a]